MIAKVAQRIVEELSSAIIGAERTAKLMLTSLLAGGHILLEGVPGLAKTMLVKGLARLLGLTEATIQLDGIPFRGFTRVQCTPDLMPSDITGSLVYNPRALDFEPRFGPVFTYILLADEVNRAIPRTQSALLQAMQEKEVTIGLRTYRLEDRDRGKFFFVAATQNPVEQEGTYKLPEAQLDRFLMRLIVDYPRTLEEEKAVLRLHMARLTEPIEDLKPAATPTWVTESQRYVAEQVKATEEALELITRLVRYTRPQHHEPARELLKLGASPRAAVSLLKAAKAHAALSGAAKATPEDVAEVAYPVLNHRLIPNPQKLIELKLKGQPYTAEYRIAEKALNMALEKAKEHIKHTATRLM
ncbi:MAG: ATPase [Thermoproteota archaeon]|nr:MAG: ATPase [Candidatus Korarchaeota archaeon]